LEAGARAAGHVVSVGRWLKGTSPSFLAASRGPGAAFELSQAAMKLADNAAAIHAAQQTRSRFAIARDGARFAPAGSASIASAHLSMHLAT
jgi:hypothetical protein